MAFKQVKKRLTAVQGQTLQRMHDNEIQLIKLVGKKGQDVYEIATKGEFSHWSSDRIYSTLTGLSLMRRGFISETEETITLPDNSVGVVMRLTGKFIPIKTTEHFNDDDWF